jgi:hypothetical protein
MFRNLGCLEWWWSGVIYSPQPPHSRWGWLLSMGALDTVRCASHVTQPLGFGRCRPLESLSSSGTGQSGAVPDRDYSVSGAPLTGGSDSARTVHHCSSESSTFVVDRCTKELLLCWCTGQSGGTPDSPVNYSRARLRNPRVRSWTLYGNLTLSGGTPDSPVRQTKALLVSLLRCFLTLSSIFYWFVLNLYAPVEHII